MYYLCINRIKSGVARDMAAKTVQLHVAWLKELIARGAIAQSGRWGDRGGMILLRAEHRQEAEQITAGDPFMQKGLVEYEIDRLFPDMEIE